MQRLSSNTPVPDDLRGGIIALGNFDGFHLGHQAVVGRAVDLARSAGRPAIIATFDPHPVRFFRPDTPPFRLTNLDQRQRLFGGAGADAMLVFEFNATLAAVPAESFIRDWLIGRAGAAGVVTGQDFTFGKGRDGNTDVLRDRGAALGLVCEAVEPVASGGETVSSSRIREALKAGDCDTATRLLTRPFAIQGAVIHGDKLGRTIGFPTANVDMGSYLRPRYGIYAVRVRLVDGRVLNGAANLGIRPTFEPPKELLETFLFDFAEDVYGQVIEVELISFIRPEAKFSDIDSLTAAMQKDCDAAREILGCQK